ncbi:MAG: acyl-CoA thioesterase [Solirubrobacterales bacterium]|nr:acyl-CoA thioesterase [Solirubrobacterales bacterium]
MPHETRLTIPLRWRDMDMLGHLNQAVYHELLEEARTACLVELDLLSRSFATYVVVRVELDYRHEVRKADGTVDVVVRVGRVGNRSFTLEHELSLPDGTLAASGVTVLAGWDMQARGARVLDEHERAALAA